MYVYQSLRPRQFGETRLSEIVGMIFSRILCNDLNKYPPFPGLFVFMDINTRNLKPRTRNRNAGCRVQGLGCRAWGVRCTVYGVRCTVHGEEYRV